MYKTELHVYKSRFVRDILNQARNLNRTSLIKEKKNIQTNKQQQEQSKKNGKRTTHHQYQQQQ